MAFLKLDRRIVNSKVFLDNDLLAFYIKLLLAAKIFPEAEKGIGLNRGQLLTSLRKLAEEFGYSLQHTRTLIKKLEETHLIEVKTSRSNSVITIINYDCDNDFPSTATQFEEAEQHTGQPVCNTASLLNKKIKNLRKQPRAQEKIISDGERRAWLVEEFGETNVAEYEQRFELWKSRQSRPIGVSCFEIIGKWLRADGVSKAKDSSFDTGGLVGMAFGVYGGGDSFED